MDKEPYVAPGQPIGTVSEQQYVGHGQPIGTISGQQQQHYGVPPVGTMGGQQMVPSQQQYVGQPIGMQPQQYMNAGPTVFIQTPIFGFNPVSTTCSNCKQSVVTTVTKEAGTCAWIWCFVICMVCCPCAWIPFVTDCSKDVRHTCPSCGFVLGFDRR